MPNSRVVGKNVAGKEISNNVLQYYSKKVTRDLNKIVLSKLFEIYSIEYVQTGNISTMFKVVVVPVVTLTAPDLL